MMLKLLLIFSSFLFAYIPKGLLILSRTAENSGNGLYQVEQEVHFPTTQENIVLKETWLVESDNTLRLTVTGGKDLKDSIKMSFVYKLGEKHFVTSAGKQSKKITEDFIEKYFHYRSSERLANAMIQMKIVPASILVRRAVRSLKDVDNASESFVQLARVGGVSAYFFGIPSASESQLSPGFWVEQDQFVIRKFRLPSGTEVAADKYSTFSRGLSFPKTRSVRWDGGSVSIQTISVKSVLPSPQLFATTNLEANKMEGLEQTGVKSLIEDFYMRFR